MILSITNQKGGVAKTTTSNNLAFAFRSKGISVLLIDMDGQGNLSNINQADTTQRTIYDVMTKECKAEDAIQTVEGVDIIPGDTRLFVIDTKLNELTKYFALKDALKDIKSKYDIIIIDTAPGFETTTINALIASDKVIIPATASMFALQGIANVYKNVENIKQHFNSELTIDGILLTLAEQHLQQHQDAEETIQHVAKQINVDIYKTRIRKNTTVAKANDARQNIFAFNAKSNGASDYLKLANELLERGILK